MEVQVFLDVMLFPLVNRHISKDHSVFVLMIKQSNKGI